MKYAIVDIETTGGHPDYHRITEIAVIVSDGKKQLERFESLVNPGTDIPAFITSLTGISNEMVEKAPTFDQIAEQVWELTQDAVFVAHNVNFDYSFLRREFEWAGYDFTRKKLCTVRLSRKIIPGLASYSLGKLCSDVGIKIKNRHRAGGDAEATFKLLKMLVKNDKDEVVSYFLNRHSGETTLPPHLPKEQFDCLPSKPGVYYFHDNKGKVLYVGKAIDIKQRIKSHFSGKFAANGSFSFFNKIYDISFQICGNELIALLLEAAEIKRLWPEFNSELKYPNASFGVFMYTDANGYIRLAASKVQKGFKPVHAFRQLAEARDFLDQTVKDYNLCPKLCGLQKTKSACYDYHTNFCNGACILKEENELYNSRVEDALSSLSKSGKTYAIVGKGREPNEKSVVVVENGIYLGFGFVDAEQQIHEFEDFKSYICRYKDDRDIHKILASYLKKAGHEPIQAKQIINC